LSSSAPPPALTSAQVRELDQLASERFGIALDWLMEAAGWQAARACDGRAAVVCGVGNNAGDGLAAAHHLHRWGRLASVSCIDRGRLRGDALSELEALLKLGVAVGDQPSFAGAELVLDAIFGTGLNRAPEGRFAEWIEAINASGLRVVAVDLPSGLDSDTGVAYSPCVRADVTVTFTLPKAGLLTADGPRMAGNVSVADIGIPNEALAAIGVRAPS
jgi:ADP-dependent NAD(P)H-hydrate dehydratase / NAD(P)H-hydrate epimerase